MEKTYECTNGTGDCNGASVRSERSVEGYHGDVETPVQKVEDLGLKIMGADCKGTAEVKTNYFILDFFSRKPSFDRSDERSSFKAAEISLH